MLKIHQGLIVLGILLCPVVSAEAQVSIGIGFPNVSIGINIPIYPEFDVVPGYPVYYAPRVDANLFFYDGMYWAYENDNWYTSSWYNGPWEYVDPEFVPLFVLRVPVRYYRQPPMYFRGWRANAAPRWGVHWGRSWEQHRSGWDRWNHSSVPARSPLPTYQKQYSGNQYPRQVEQQRQIIQKNYQYQPHDPAVRQQFQGRAVQKAPVQQATPQQARPQRDNQAPSAERGIRQPETWRVTPHQQNGPAAAPRAQSPQTRGRDVQRLNPASPQQEPRGVQGHQQPSQQGATQQQKRAKKPADQQDQQQQQQQGNDAGQQHGQDQGRSRDRNQ